MEKSAELRSGQEVPSCGALRLSPNQGGSKISQENRASRQKQIEEAETKIKQLERQNTRLENRGRYLQKGERAKCTHHLCDMGGAIQAISPEADRLPKSQFYCLMERVFALPEVRRLVQQAQEEG